MLATALRARAKEDTSPRLYTDEQEDALLAARRSRAAAAFTDAALTRSERTRTTLATTPGSARNPVRTGVGVPRRDQLGHPRQLVELIAELHLDRHVPVTSVIRGLIGNT